MAIWFVILLFECALVELPLAVAADEMLRMVFPIHRCDAATRNRFAAAGTERPALRMEVCLAVRHALVLEKRTSTKPNSTFLE